MNGDQSLVKTDAQDQFDMTLLANTSLVTMAEEAEKRLEAFNKLKRIALKATNPSDWVDEAGKPYLQGSGAEKIARLFGISWRPQEPVRIELENGNYEFSYTGEFALWGSVITVVGSRSSKDSFFKKYKYVGEGDKKERIELPVTEIDAGDVRKSAFTNWEVNGVTRLLGLRNLTYADLKEYANIDASQISKVEYKSRGKPAAKSIEKSEPDFDPNAPANDEQCMAIYNIVKGQLGITDQYKQHEKVMQLLGLKKVPTALKQLTFAQAATVIPKLQEEAKVKNSQ